MTEAEWLACNDSRRTLFLSGKERERKLRLFAVACCRQIGHLQSDVERSAVEVAERMADGLATNAERRAAALAAHSSAGCALSVAAIDAADNAARNARDALARSLTTEPYWKRYHVPNPAYGPMFEQAQDKAAAAQAPLLREIFGNPFRPVVIDPALRTSTVVSLAQAIYDERAFDRLPILAAALEDAGCDNRDILDHCRQPGEHVRGCWVVDLVLGKS